MDFVNFLTILSSSDNAQRFEAETKYKALCEERGDTLPLLLLQTAINVSNGFSGGQRQGTNTPQHIRKLSAVLLRRLLIEQDESAYRHMTDTGQASLRQGLMAALDAEDDLSMLSSLSDIAGELTGYILEQNEWPEIIPYAYNNLQSQDPFKREMGLNLLGLVANSHINVLTSAVANIQAIIRIYTANLNDLTNEGRILLASIRSLASIVTSISQNANLEPFQELVGPIINGLMVAITANQQNHQAISETTIISYIEAMIDLVESKCAFVEYQLAYAFDSLLRIVESTAVSSPIRRMSLEVLVTICAETPKRVRKLKSNEGKERYVVIRRIINACIEFMGQLVDDESWERAITIEDVGAYYDVAATVADTTTNAIGDSERILNADCGESSLDRILKSLGVNCTISIINETVLRLLQSNANPETGGNWRYAYVGFHVLALFLDETSNMHKKNEIMQYCSFVIKIFDSYLLPDNYATLHPRVKGAVFYALSRFISNQGKGLIDIAMASEISGSSSLSSFDESVNCMNQSNLITAADILNAIKRILQYLLNNSISSSNPSPRIRRYVIGCIMNFIEICPRPFLEDKVHAILLSVTQALSEGPVIVQEFAIFCIVSLCETLRDGFYSSDLSKAGNKPFSDSVNQNMASYYDSLMPILKAVLYQAHVGNVETLWGQTFECCAILGEACGKSKFHSDAVEMMNTLINHHQMKPDAEMNKHLMKAWVRIARCLGAEILPYIHTVMDKLMFAIMQDPSANTEHLQLEDCEDRSDIHMIEREDGSWLPVRTAVVEEQSLACQLLVLLAEKLQEFFYKYVEQVVRVMIPLLKSPHEDVRSYAMVIIPELIRSTAKATTAHASNSDRSVLVAMTEYCLGQLIEAIEAESSLELVATGLQTFKMCLHYACTDWPKLLQQNQKLAISAVSHKNGSQMTANLFPEKDSISSLYSWMDEPPTLVPEKSIPILNAQQMDAITSMTKIILRESIQRRSVLRAEAQISGGIDEDDEAEEELYMHESLELHFVLSEVLGSLFKSHGPIFYSTYLNSWHEIVLELSQLHCLKEDQQFALYIACDVIEYGLSPDTISQYFSQIMPNIFAILSKVPHPNPRQAAAYAIGVAAEKYGYNYIYSYIPNALEALSSSISIGDEDGKGSRGECTDNAVAAVGLLLEVISTSNTPQTMNNSYDFIWDNWISYLPIKHDLDEGRKVLKQLIRLISTKNPSFFNEKSKPTTSANGISAIPPKSPTSIGNQQNRLRQSLMVLLNVYQTKISSYDVDREIDSILYNLRFAHLSEQLCFLPFDQIAASLPAELRLKIDYIIQNLSNVNGSQSNTVNQELGCSPGPSAPIQDLLFRP